MPRKPAAAADVVAVPVVAGLPTAPVVAGLPTEPVVAGLPTEPVVAGLPTEPHRPTAGLLARLPLVLAIVLIAAMLQPGRCADAPPNNRAQDVAYSCDFTQSIDPAIRWPTGWSRKADRGWPAYVKIGVEREGPPSGGASLAIVLAGAPAAVRGPAIPLDPLYEYVLDAYVQAEGLRRDRASVSLSVHAGPRGRATLLRSAPISGTTGWQRVRLGPVSPSGENAHATIGFDLTPSELPDLHGSVRLGDVRLRRVPRLSLGSNDPQNLFTTGSPVDVQCTISGLGERRGCAIRWRLEDPFGRELAKSQAAMELAEDERTAMLRWRPLATEPGFYRVEVRLETPDARSGDADDAALYRRTLNLVVIDPAAPPGNSDFGWSLPSAKAIAPQPGLFRWLPQSGIRRAKLPLWLDDGDPEALTAALRMAQFFEQNGIGLVGVLDAPPAAVREALPRSASLADVLACDRKLWGPSLDRVMLRMATQVAAWQLGDDGDLSVCRSEDPHARAASAQAALDRIGLSTRVGLPWDGRALPLARGGSPCRFFSYRGAVDSDGSQAQLPTVVGAARWLAVQTPPRDLPLDARLRALLQQVLAAKTADWEAVYFSKPIGDDGLLREDGSPTELLLPWRTLALQLGGARALGPLELPSGSRNVIFVRDGEALMLLWNDEPTTELEHFGGRMRQVDLWGRTTEVEEVRGRHGLRAQRLPVFVLGLDPAIARWRVGLALDRPRVPSVFGQLHANVARVENSFGRRIEGKVTIVCPSGWQIEPKQAVFDVPADGQLICPFAVRLPYSAVSGRQRLRFDFELTADRPYRFSVYREIEVGLGDITLAAATQLTDAGELEVRLRLGNHEATRVSFRCNLSVPGRARQSLQILDLGEGEHERVFRLPKGKELLGKQLWLTAEEIGGERTLSQRLEVKP